MEYDNYDMDEYGNLDFTEPSKDEKKSTITQPQITRVRNICFVFLLPFPQNERKMY